MPINKNQYILNLVDPGSALTNEFTVDTHAVRLVAAGLVMGDTISLQQYAGPPGAGYWQDVARNGVAVVLTIENSQHIEIVGGRYRVTYVGASATAVVWMEEEFEDLGTKIVYSFTQPYTNSGTTGPFSVTGTLPVAVTGTGTIVDPYAISAVNASNADMEAGTSSVVVVEPSSLSHLLGASTAGQNARLGVGSVAGTPGGVSVGYLANAASTSVSIGSGSSSTTNGTAVGTGASAAGANSIAVGRLSTANFSDSVALGGASATNGVQSVAIGTGADAGTSGCVSIGNIAISSGLSAVALGYNTNSGAVSGVAIGASSSTTGSNSVAIGVQASSALASVAVGPFVSAAGQQSVVLGNNSSVDSSSSVVIGHGAESPVGNDQSVYIGYQAGNGSSGSGNNIVVGNGALQFANPTSSIIIGAAAGSSGLAALPVTGNSATIAIGNGAGTGDGVSTDMSNFDLGIYIGQNAGTAEVFSNNIIISSSTGPTNAVADNDIILGNSSHVILRTAGSVISGGVIGPSDERLKRDIEDYTGGLDLVKKLSAKKFLWDEAALDANKVPHIKSEVHEQQYGLIAQDVLDVFPEVVTRPYGNELMGVRYERLIPVLVSAIKTLSEKVDALELKLGNSNAD